MSKKTHHVYVIELDKKVWTERSKFRQANPHYRGIMCCLYVGMTSHTPKERYAKHKAGARSKNGHKISSSYVEKYGIYLRPSMYNHLNPLTKAEAIQLEKSLATSLKQMGYAVWWN